MTKTRELYAPIVRLIIQLIVLAVINWILTELPMLRAISVPQLMISMQAIISLVIGIIMVVLLILFRRDFIPGLRSEYPKFTQAVDIVSAGINLAIIIVAYTMFDGALRPLMKQFAWAYPVIFLAIALWPLYILIFTLYRSSIPIADWIFTKITDNPAENQRQGIKCQSCGKGSPARAKFCPDCGASLTSPSDSVTKCAVCGAVKRPSDRYCMNCGTSIEEEQYDTRVSV